MNKENGIGTKGILIILAVAAGFCACFWLGRLSLQEEYRRERELNITLARSDLQGLGEIKETIYVTGHRNPDTDTVACAIAYADLLNKLGYDAVPVVQGPISKETAWLLEQAGVPIPEIMTDAAGKMMVLVDHSEVLHSAEGIQDARIISIIDHHGTGDITARDAMIYDARPIGAAATIVWLRYRNYGVDYDKKIATILLGAILSDTSNRKSDATTEADLEAIQSLSRFAGITDPNGFYQEMTKAKYDYSGFSDEEIYLGDSKQYEGGSLKYSIGCVSAYDEEAAKDLCQRMKQIMPEIQKKTGMDMTIAQISIFHDDISITYLVPGNEIADEVIRTAYEKEAEFDGTAYIIEPGFSRKKLVAALNDVLESYPKE